MELLLIVESRQLRNIYELINVIYELKFKNYGVKNDSVRSSYLFKALTRTKTKLKKIAVI